MMLFLTFQLGEHRYAIEAGRVREVLPFVQLKPLPQSPPGVAGLLNYRGCPVPVVDLSGLALGRACRERFSTRILVTHYQTTEGGEQLLGLIAEGATGLLRRERNQFVESGANIAAAPYLGPVLIEGSEVIQLIEHQKLISHPLETAIQAALECPVK